MDLAEVIRERRTIQNFTAEKVPEEWVREALELSLWAPNHRLTFPWHYTLVGGESRQRLANLALELKAKKGPVSATATTAIRNMILNPSHLLMLGLKIEEDAAINKENFATLACGVQNLSLVLWEKGVGVKWSTSGFTKHSSTYDILQLAPTQVQLEGCLFIGKAQMIPEAKARPSFDQVVHWVS